MITGILYLIRICNLIACGIKHKQWLAYFNRLPQTGLSNHLESRVFQKVNSHWVAAVYYNLWNLLRAWRRSHTTMANYLSHWNIHFIFMDRFIIFIQWDLIRKESPEIQRAMSACLGKFLGAQIHIHVCIHTNPWSREQLHSWEGCFSILSFSWKAITVKWGNELNLFHDRQVNKNHSGVLPHPYCH